ncbi:MAG: hypothetical protein ABJJ50_23805, partial [Reichenbachiella sp.]
QTRASVWENAAIAHALIFNKLLGNKNLTYTPPEIHLDHVYALTDQVGMIQFSTMSDPDINTGYTLDDNARALIAVCMHYDQTRDIEDLNLITTYLNFIEYCQQPTGDFLNYVDKDRNFHVQNHYTNLEDSNGRAIWALGVLIDHESILPDALVQKAKAILDQTLVQVSNLESPRAIAFVIKGLYHACEESNKEQTQFLINGLAGKLKDQYNLISAPNWEWFEEYLTYANSVLPEAMLYAYMATGNSSYKHVALTTFEFLLSKLFKANSIKVISNRGWLQKDRFPNEYGEQPIEISYTIQALELFYQAFKEGEYLRKMRVAFSWFLGNNHLHQIIYNPLTGGCYDGLEKYSPNLNQGAESTVCYLIARLIIEKHKSKVHLKINKRARSNKKLVYSTQRPVSKGSIKAKVNPFDVISTTKSLEPWR